MQKFNTLLENVWQPYQRGNFLVGDLVKFKNGWESHDWVKGLIEGKLTRLKEMMESGDNLRVCAIKTDRESNNDMGPFWVDIVREAAPGAYRDFLTIPEGLLDKIDLGINRAPISDSQVKDDPSHIKPADPSLPNANAYHDMVKQTRCTHPAKEMPGSNVKLPGAKAATSYTTKYMEM